MAPILEGLENSELMNTVTLEVLEFKYIIIFKSRISPIALKYE